MRDFYHVAKLENSALPSILGLTASVDVAKIPCVCVMLNRNELKISKETRTKSGRNLSRPVNSASRTVGVCSSPESHQDPLHPKLR